MELYATLALFAISLALLIKSSGLLVHTLSRIAAFLEVPEFIVSFALMGLATSSPEIIVSVLAALRGDTLIAFGNNIGSNIFYPSILFGLVAILARKFPVPRAILFKDFLFAALISLVPFLFLLDRRIDRFEGLVLIAIFVLFFNTVLRQGGILRHRHRYEHVMGEGHKRNLKGLKGFLADVAIFFVGLAILLLSAEGVVRGAVSFAEALGLSVFVISVIVIAGSVALPELSFGLRAALSGKTDMVLGNISGALAINTGLALGLAAIINPIVFTNYHFVIVSAVFAFAALAFFFFFAWWKGYVSWRFGVILVAIYLAFVFTVLSPGFAGTLVSP